MSFLRSRIPFNKPPGGLFIRLLISVLCISYSFGIEWERVTVNGFTSIEVEKQVDKNGQGDPNYSFDADLFDLLFNFQMGENMRATMDLSWNHGSENRYGSTNLEYAFLEHTLLDAFKLRIGKMRTPFGLNNEISRAKPAYYSVSTPNSTNNPQKLLRSVNANGSLAAGFGYPFFPEAGVGIALQGGTTFEFKKNLEYIVFVSNGYQPDSVNPYEFDGNKSKAITARLKFDFSSDLQLVKSFYIDNPYGMILTPDTDTSAVSRILTDGYGFEYTNGDFRLTGEAILGFFVGQSKSDSTNASGFNRNNVQQKAGYIQPSYGFSDGWLAGITPYLRYEIYQPDAKYGGDLVHTYVAGIHYEISNLYIFKFEYNYFDYIIDSPELNSPNLNSYGIIKSSLVLGF